VSNMLNAMSNCFVHYPDGVRLRCSTFASGFSRTLSEQSFELWPHEAVVKEFESHLRKALSERLDMIT
jgi:hypothetical protein